MTVVDVLAGVLLVVGAAFILLAAVGVVRFEDAFSRMHAAAKGPALGILCLSLGTALAIRTLQAFVTAVLVVVLQFIAGPVSAHLLGRSIYRRFRPDLQGPDELAPAIEQAEQQD